MGLGRLVVWWVGLAWVELGGLVGGGLGGRLVGRLGWVGLGPPRQ